MYDAPADLLTVLGWSLAGLVLLLGALRAVRVERGRPAAGPAGTLVLDTGLAVLVVALLGVLVTIVAAGLG